ncbi:MAG: hypothetical protein ACYCYL_12430 [Acidithiobacillus sp.]
MAKHEQAVIDSFNRFFEKQATEKGCKIRSFSLDGQDALAGADYILTDQSRFALVEFKYTQAEILAESKKGKRLNLCTELELHPDMKFLHDQCHFIAWAEATQMKAQCNIYRLEVCNKQIFGAESGLHNKSPSSDNRIYAKQFTTEFFSGLPPRSLSLSEFESYVEWLLQVASGSSKSSFELLTYDETSDECAMIKLSSIRAAYNWMKMQQPQDTPSTSPCGI